MQKAKPRTRAMATNDINEAPPSTNFCFSTLWKPPLSSGVISSASRDETVSVAASKRLAESAAAANFASLALSAAVVVSAAVAAVVGLLGVVLGAEFTSVA